MTHSEFAKEFDLTSKEMQVAVAIARGTDTRQIAREMEVSWHTVRHHLKIIFHKTDTHRQSALVVLFLKGNQCPNTNTYQR